MVDPCRTSVYLSFEPFETRKRESIVIVFTLLRRCAYRRSLRGRNADRSSSKSSSSSSSSSSSGRVCTFGHARLIYALSRQIYRFAAVAELWEGASWPPSPREARKSRKVIRWDPRREEEVRMLSMRSHAPGVSINSAADWAEPSSMYRWTRVKHVCERCVSFFLRRPHYRVAMRVTRWTNLTPLS